MTNKTILDAVRETAKGLHKAGAMNATTMREFGALCLPTCQTLQCRADQEAAAALKSEPGCVRRVLEHQPIYRSEMGAG